MRNRIGSEFTTFCVGFAIALALFIVFKLGVGDLITGAIIAGVAGVVGNVGWHLFKRRGSSAASAQKT